MCRLDGIEQRMREYKPRIMESKMESSVMIPIVEHAGKLHVLFELRSDSLKRQPGEVCFPGGKREGDETPDQCACRETAEELGIAPGEVQLLGQFDILHNYTNLTIFTFVGTLSSKAMSLLSFGSDGRAAHIANSQEVQDLFLVPLSFFQKQKPYIYHYKVKPEIGTDFPYEILDCQEKYTWRTGAYTVPIFRYGQYVIWGITARILCNFMEKIAIGKI